MQAGSSVGYTRGMWARAMTGTARPIILLLGILVFLGVIYAPARDYFHSTGDVYLYDHYAQQALAAPMELPREYPPLTAAIFVLPKLVLPTSYPLGFALFAALGTWLTVLVVDRLSRQGWWLLLYLVLGAFGTLFFRFDILVVLLTVLAFAAAARERWVVAQALLALGVAFKLYPAILMPLVVLWEWRVTRRLPLKSGLGGVLLLLLAVGSMWLLAPAQFVSMLRYHQDRPLEFEALGASLAWLLSPVTAVFSFGSWNLISPLSPILITASTGLNILLLLLLYGAFMQGRLDPGTAWLLALVIQVVTSKVFSTQYLIWILPFALLAGWVVPGAKVQHSYTRWFWALICLLTSAVYPIALERYAVPVMQAQQAPGWMMVLVTLRNALLVVVALLALIQGSRTLATTSARTDENGRG